MILWERLGLLFKWLYKGLAFCMGGSQFTLGNILVGIIWLMIGLCVEYMSDVLMDKINEM